MTKTFWAVSLFVVLALAALSMRQRWDSSEHQLHVSGTIEVTEVRVSFRLPGKVSSVLVKEGDQVSQGQVIANLDPEELEHEVAVRQAEKTIAESGLKELQSGSLPEEIAQIKAKRDQADADFQRLKTDYQRQQQLLSRQVISKREFDASQTSYEVAKSRLQEAEKALLLLQNGAREEKLDQAKARLLQAGEALALAETRLGYTVLKAPLEGFILSKNIEAGEYVMAGTPIVTIGNLQDIWLRAYINETELGKITLGKEVQVITDSYPHKVYPGKISFISPEAEFTPKNVQTTEERVKLVYRIKVTLHNPDNELKPGMPADGTILLETHR